MKIFVDSIDIDQIKELNAFGIIDGATTNPTLIKKSGRNYCDVIGEICNEIKGPVSAEVVADNCHDMIKEGVKLVDISPNIVVKVPFTDEGLKAAIELLSRGTKVNITLCFSLAQAIIAAKIGATFISPFVGRLDDIHVNGMDLIESIATVYKNYNFQTEILVASIRSVNHILEASLMGAHIITAPTKIIKEMFSHPLTTKGLEIFNTDWQETKQSII